MPEETNMPVAAGSPTAKRWAVVCTGFITPQFLPKAIATDDGKTAPVIIKLCKDEADARRMLRRLSGTHGKVDAFTGQSWEVCQPIYGVAETDLTYTPKAAPNGTATPAKRGRKPKNG